MYSYLFGLLLTLAFCIIYAQEESPKLTLITNVNVWNGTSTSLKKADVLIENNLIKEYRPRYNVLLRDDKSYPYIYISDKDKYPRIDVHRGARKKPGYGQGPALHDTAPVC